MTVITLTGDLGSMGRVDRLTAQRLDYDLLEPELTIDAAQALAFPEKRMEALGKRTGGLGPRFAALLSNHLAHTKARPGTSLFVGGIVEEVMARTYAETAGARMTADDRQYFQSLQDVVRYFARQGNMVIVGRGAQLMLANARDTVHVRVYCPFDERVQRVAKAAKSTTTAVRRRVQDSDRERDAWHRKYFGADYQALEHYHAVVNVARMSDEHASEVIIDVAHALGRTRAKAAPPASAPSAPQTASATDRVTAR